VEVVSVPGAESAIVLRAPGEVDTRVPFRTIVGIRFEVRHEKLRDKVDGRLVVVTRTSAVGLRQWASWIYFLVFFLATAYSIHKLIGPFTSFITLCVWAISVTRSFFNAGSMPIRRRKTYLQSRSMSMSNASSIEGKSSMIYTPPNGPSVTPIQVHSATPPILLARPPEHSCPPPINLSFDDESGEDGEVDDSKSPECFRRRKFFRAADALGSLVEARNLCKEDGGVPKQSLLDGFRRNRNSTRPLSEEKRLSLSSRYTSRSLSNMEHETSLERDDIDFSHLVHSRRLSSIQLFRQRSFPERGPDGTGVPLGPLINWSGQLSVFYLLMWQVPTAIGVPLPKRIIGCVIAAILLISIRSGRRKGKLKAMWHERASAGPFGSMRLFRPPVPTFPLKIEYKQSQLPKLFELRSAVLAIPAGRAAVQDVAVGGYWTEGITSALLPSGLYNNRKLRQLAHMIINFLIPAFFILQGFSVLLPWAWGVATKLGVLLHNDRGVHLLRQIVRTAGSFLTRLMRSFSVFAPDFYQILIRAAYPIRITVRLSTRLVRGALGIVWDYIVPSDAVLTYIRARFAELQSLASPAVVLAGKLSKGASQLVRFITAPVSALFRLFTSIASILGNVLTGSLGTLYRAVGPLFSLGITLFRHLFQPIRILVVTLWSLIQLFFELISTIGRTVVSLVTSVLGLVRSLALRVPGLAKFAKQIGDQFIALQKRDPLFWQRLRSVSAVLTVGFVVSLTAVLVSPAIAITISVATAIPMLIFPSLRQWIVDRILRHNRFTASEPSATPTPPPPPPDVPQLEMTPFSPQTPHNTSHEYPLISQSDTPLSSIPPSPISLPAPKEHKPEVNVIESSSRDRGKLQSASLLLLPPGSLAASPDSNSVNIERDRRRCLSSPDLMCLTHKNSVDSKAVKKLTRVREALVTNK